MNEQLPQLHMKRSLAALPKLEVPGGYRLRHFEPDDVHVWAALMARNGELGAWDTAKAAAFFAPDSGMALEGAFFLLAGDEPVATAQLDVAAGGPYAALAELGWVAVDPLYRGSGLGGVVCLAVMHYAVSAGYREIFLRTDDQRLPAIWTYLKLGFEPWITDPSHPGRWQAVREELGRRR